VASTTESIRFAQGIQAMEAAVGIEVVIDTADAATVVARQTRGQFDVAFGGFQPGTVEPNSMLNQFFGPTG
jgi:ABC-type transport system substrate-binding protein